ncbi:MAG TPA: c-type cytochrome biogenesis protein CcmI [Acetobacteraceae bacterium]|nr:c-type cytochrome biogenesis protein CcmI [Acetobacteraceae bacterium]
MIWLALLILAGVALAPLALAMRRGLGARTRREAALALHRAQLAELGRDLAEGRIAPGEHGQAVLEVQRRLLAEAAAPETRPTLASRGPLLAVLLIVPAGALVLYLMGGHPDMPAEPLAKRIAQAQLRMREEMQLIGQLRERLARLDPSTEQAREGFKLLGNVEASLGDWADAAEAWHKALASKFEATLAVEAAEASSRAEGKVSQDSAELFRRALREGPPDAPWRSLAERRLQQAPPPSSASK